MKKISAAAEVKDAIKNQTLYGKNRLRGTQEGKDFKFTLHGINKKPILDKCPVDKSPPSS